MEYLPLLIGHAVIPVLMGYRALNAALKPWSDGLMQIKDA